MNAREVAAPKARLFKSGKGQRRIHIDMIAVGGLSGAVAGVLFAMNIGFLYLITLDQLAVVELVQADYLMGAYLAALAIGPLAWLWTRITSPSARRPRQFWLSYNAGVIWANFQDVRYWADTEAIPAFLNFIETSTIWGDAIGG